MPSRRRIWVNASIWPSSISALTPDQFDMLSQVIYLLTTLLVGVWAQNSSAGLDFGPVDFAGYDNYVYRDNVTSCQIVVTK